MGQLLRKKLEPDVEDLVARARETAERASPEGLAKIQEVWDEARGWIQRRIATYVVEEAGDVYTKQEREMGVEKVRTGLKRDLEEDDDDDDEDNEEDEDEDEGGEKQQEKDQPRRRGPELETLLWFGARGDFEPSPNIEYERKGPDVYRGLQGIRLPPQPGQDTEMQDQPPAQQPS